MIACERVPTASVIEIPDAKCLEALLDQNVDQNGDGTISEEEAQTLTTLQLWPSGISDLTGIEHFVNLESLSIQLNAISSLSLSNNKALQFLECIGCELTDLDLSENQELRHLDCSGALAMVNSLTSLDLSANTYLEYLDLTGNKLEELDLSSNEKLNTLLCGYNQLKSLDVTSNKELTRLGCNNNQLMDIDVSQNPGLTTLITCGNKLTRLDISGNISLTKVGIDNMQSLVEVCVWVLPFPPQGVTVLSGYSPNIKYTTDCSQ